jgi:photosystem II stability/assembly factor-like uncharacterized protein
MPKANPDQVVTQKHRRAFSQRGGPRPNNRVRYAGADEQLMEFDDATSPVRGGSDPIRVHDPRRRGGYVNVGSTVDPPDFDSGSINFMVKHGGISWLAGDLTCANNFYELVGVCRKPDDFTSGWTDFVRVYSYAQANDRSYTGNTTFEDDDGSMTEIEYTFEGGIYDVGALGFGEQGGQQVEREVVDVVFGSTLDCGNCGNTDDGTGRIYAVTKSSGAGSPGTPAEVVYTTDGGATWNNVNITGLGGTADPTGIAVVGNFLVVLDSAGGGYYYAEINTLTGVPGTWTNVTSGFVAGKAPNDLYVAGASEVYFAGDGGYLYKSTDITAGVTAINAASATTADLQRIHGVDETIVAVGESGAIVVSTNRGATFATATTSPTSATIRALWVLDAYRAWIGTSGGKVYYTLTAGATWIEQTFSGAAVIDDIVFATDEVGYVAARTATPAARLHTTYNGGANWSSSATTGNPRILNFPTFARANRIAVPVDVPNVTAANNVVLGGLSAGGTDGVIFQGIATKV